MHSLIQAITLHKVGIAGYLLNRTTSCWWLFWVLGVGFLKIFKQILFFRNRAGFFMMILISFMQDEMELTCQICQVQSKQKTLMKYVDLYFVGLANNATWFNKALLPCLMLLQFPNCFCSWEKCFVARFIAWM